MVKNTQYLKEEIMESHKFSKKMIKEGVLDYLKTTVKDMREENRLKNFSSFEKQIYFYQKGYDKTDKRLQQYINDFRYYYKAVYDQSVKNLKNKEILNFLTKHYYEDIKPNIDNPDMIFKAGGDPKLLFPNYNLITMSDLSSINRDLTNPAIHNESEEKKEKILYSAVVLDEDSRDKLLALLRLCVDVPEDWKLLGHHMTIIFKEGLPEELRDDLNEDVTLTVKSIGVSDDAIAVGVEGYPSTKDTPHITLAIPPDGKPVNSNYIEDWRDVEDEILLRGKVSEIRPTYS